MTLLEKLEAFLDDTLNKKSPINIPEKGRKALAGALWWLAAIFGVLQLWAAWILWRVGHSDGYGYADYLSSAQTRVDLGSTYYLAFFVILITALIALFAVPALKAGRKAGWNLMFYSLMINVAYSVILAISNYGGVGNLFTTLLGSFIGAYLLFQLRSQFHKK